MSFSNFSYFARLTTNQKLFNIKTKYKNNINLCNIIAKIHHVGKYLHPKKDHADNGSQRQAQAC